MTTASTPAQWADRIGAHVRDWILDLGYNDALYRVGNPNVSGDGGCGPEVHVDLNTIYRCEEPWPSPLRDTTARSKPSDMDAVEFSVRIRACVPVLREDGKPPDERERADSVRDMAELGLALHQSLWCGVAEWRPQYGRVSVDRVESLRKEGGFAAWECLVVAPINCLECP